jgi:Nif-specific regulatory protein
MNQHPASWLHFDSRLLYQPAQSHTSAQLEQALQAHGGNQSRAAQALGLTARQLGYRLKKMGLRNGDNL